MTNSGFPNVREITEKTFAANGNFFIDRTLTIAAIEGTGASPINTVGVETTTAHGLSVGDSVTITDVPTQTDYNLDNSVIVTAIGSIIIFEYETSNHTNSTLDTGGGTVTVLDPYIVNETVNDLGQFVHLNAGLDASSIIEITKDATNYVQLANGDSLIGDIFRSIIVKNGDKINFRTISAIDIEYGTLYREP